MYGTASNDLHGELENIAALMCCLQHRSMHALSASVALGACQSMLLLLLLLLLRLP
jgi:hypothetical protein